MTEDEARRLVAVLSRSAIIKEARRAGRMLSAAKQSGQKKTSAVRQTVDSQRLHSAMCLLKTASRVRAVAGALSSLGDDIAVHGAPIAASLFSTGVRTAPYAAVGYGGYKGYQKLQQVKGRMALRKRMKAIQRQQRGY